MCIRDSRQAHFFWLPDLSSADPYHILPIVMMGTSFLVQFYTPSPGVDPQQQKMMAFMMPAFSGYFTWSYASGLALYWNIGNLIMIIQQAVMNRTDVYKRQRLFGAGWCSRPPRCILAVAGLRSKAAILARSHHAGLRWRHLEHHLVQLQPQSLYGLANMVPITLPDVLKLLGGDAYIERPAGNVGEPRRLEPCLIALPVDLLFECTQDAIPLVGDGGWNRNIGHRRRLPSFFSVQLQQEQGHQVLQ